MSSVTSVPIVPKKVYFFWGKQKMSWLRYMTLWTFKKFNPNWSMYLYVYDTPIKNKYWENEEDQDFFRYDGDDYFERAIKLATVREWKGGIVTGPSHQSNLFKWTMLSTQGGVYSDMDILWVKPFDIYEEFRHYDVALSCFDNVFSIGLLGSTSGNKVFERILEETKKVKDFTRYQSMGVEVLYRLLDLQEVYKIEDTIPRRFNLYYMLQVYFPGVKFFNLPRNWIYPFKCFEIDNLFERVVSLPENCIGIHWYAGAAISQRWNIMLDESKLVRFDSTLVRALKRVLE